MGGADFINVLVGDEGVCLVLERLAETCHKEALGDGAAHGHGMSLAKRAGSVLDAAPQIMFGMPHSKSPARSPTSPH